jgi:RNA polymerase sigma-70 factor (ECF subfamily)
MYAKKKDEICDVEQEVLMQLWKAFPRYDSTYKLSTWIYRIALNTAISYYRREKKHDCHCNIENSVFQLAEHVDTSETDEQIKLMYRCIEEFNELDKALLLLYLDDNSYEEISNILGITVTNVATKVSRLKQRLKKQMVNN